MANQITSASTAEYFSKNLQQIGFSSPTKAVLTTLKEALDNALDACEEAKILPEIYIEIKKVGAGTIKGTDLIQIKVRDNGPGIDKDFVPKVFGEYLASSKFGRGRCSRGQQGLGISAATTWAQVTAARGVLVTTKTKKEKEKKAYQALIEVDIKNNKGLIKEERSLEAAFPHGTEIEFILDGKLQLNGEAGIKTYLSGTALVNPSLSLRYKILDEEEVVLNRVSEVLSEIPDAVLPHPHTMKLGEFISHLSLFPKQKLKFVLENGFSRISDSSLKDLVKRGFKKQLLSKEIEELNDLEKKELYSLIQDLKLLPPSTKSVRKIGEENLEKSISRLGDLDFFSVIERPATICDFKPVKVEVAIARLKEKRGLDEPVQVLRFANLVPLQFDKKACVTTEAITTVNWKSYGLNQPKESLPQGPYIFAISISSPFIKFKNASKETIDESEELLSEIRLALIQAGQRLSKHIKLEQKKEELESKRRYIEQFSPILIKFLEKITDAPAKDIQAAEKGLKKILGRDIDTTEEDLASAQKRVEKLKGDQ